MPTEVEGVMDRVRRWARSLPFDEPIPIHSDELWEFSRAVGGSRWGGELKADVVMLKYLIEHQNYRFEGHTVVLI